MGIRLNCPNGHKLHLKSFLAGRRGICPHCGARFDIPSERLLDAPSESLHPGGGPTPLSRASSGVRPPAKHGSSAALATLDVERLLGLSNEREIPAAIDAAPAAQWYVRLASGEQFGPADGPVMQGWLAEERVPDDAYVWREGWSDWQLAGSVFGGRATASAQPAPAEAVFAETVIERDLYVRPTTRAALGNISPRNKRANRLLIAALALAALLLVPVLIYVLNL
jgi:GYF domain 2